MSDKPLYYSGDPASSPGANGPTYYAPSPSSNYGGGYGYYGGGAGYYGKGAGYGGNAGGGGDDSLVGAITIGRMLRVIMQRWLTIFVFLLVGLVVSFAVYRVSPTVYQATSQFSMDMRRSSGGSRGGAIAELTPDYGTSYAEIFNTRLSDWRGDRIVSKIVQRYRADHPASTVPDEQIVGTICGSSLELQRLSRNINITIRSHDPQLAAALANAYAEAIEAFTDEENKIRCDKAVAQIHANVEKKRREVDRIAKQLLDFRTANKVDNLRSGRDTIQQGLSKTTGDILGLETQETQLIEWEKLLKEVQKAPETFGSLSSGVPRAEEIASEYRAYQEASRAYQALLVSYTEAHPEVKSKKGMLDVARQRFLDAASRALLTGRSTLQVVRNQLANLRVKQEQLRNDLADIEQRIVLAESGLGQLDAGFSIANDVLKGLILDENKARMEAENNNEIVRVGRPATVPGAPILPNPKMIFGAGVALSVALGILFVLVLDNLEDTVVNLGDIEIRLALKVLAVLPHVRRKKREEVAKFTIDDKFSQFSEAVAGLRNLLDSPRYEALTHCMVVISTQPGEGKTVTSSSIAISYAQSGKRTLLVDFDLRRPRQAHVWDLALEKERSFSHVLQAANEGKLKPDFAKIANTTRIERLDVIASLPPEGVDPSTILGSAIAREFFDWARANYERIVVDAPPYGIVGDVVSLAVLVDSALIMCCPDRTHLRPIQHCSRCLTEAGANILGVVVNDVEVSNVSAFNPTSQHKHYGYGYGGYGGYGYGYGDSKRRHRHGSSAAKHSEDEDREEFSDDE